MFGGNLTWTYGHSINGTLVILVLPSLCQGISFSLKLTTTSLEKIVLGSDPFLLYLLGLFSRCVAVTPPKRPCNLGLLPPKKDESSVFAGSFRSLSPTSFRFPRIIRPPNHRINQDCLVAFGTTHQVGKRRTALAVGGKKSKNNIVNRQHNPWLTFHCAGWFLGILIMVYHYNPYITG